MAQEMERIFPEEEEEPKKQPLEAKKCPLAAKLFCFPFFFLWDLWEQCQQLIIFSIHQHFEFKLAALLL